jgi:hypothetical protein
MKNLDEWEALARVSQVDLTKLTCDQVEHCHGFCWACVKRWCSWNEIPPLRTGSRNTELISSRAVNSSIK